MIASELNQNKKLSGVKPVIEVGLTCVKTVARGIPDTGCSAELLNQVPTTGVRVRGPQPRAAGKKLEGTGF